PPKRCTAAQFGGAVPAGGAGRRGGRKAPQKVGGAPAGFGKNPPGGNGVLQVSAGENDRAPRGTRRLCRSSFRSLRLSRIHSASMVLIIIHRQIVHALGCGAYRDSLCGCSVAEAVTQSYYASRTLPRKTSRRRSCKGR